MYIASISYGKDSLKMLDVIKTRGLPLDRIITFDVWATDTILAEYPEVTEFKKRTAEITYIPLVSCLGRFTHLTCRTDIPVPYGVLFTLLQRRSVLASRTTHHSDEPDCKIKFVGSLDTKI